MLKIDTKNIQLELRENSVNLCIFCLENWTLTVSLVFPLAAGFGLFRCLSMVSKLVKRKCIFLNHFESIYNINIAVVLCEVWKLNSHVWKRIQREEANLGQSFRWRSRLTINMVSSIILNNLDHQRRTLKSNIFSSFQNFHRQKK